MNEPLELITKERDEWKLAAAAEAAIANGYRAERNAALKRIEELEKYDLRQYIPEGKWCDACWFRRDYPDLGIDSCCPLLNVDLKSYSGSSILKHQACPKPYKEDKE